MSAGARCCACSMRKRRSRGPFPGDALEDVEQRRFARSPIACTMTCSPAVSAPSSPGVEILRRVRRSSPRSPRRVGERLEERGGVRAERAVDEALERADAQPLVAAAVGPVALTPSAAAAPTCRAARRRRSGCREPVLRTARARRPRALPRCPCGAPSSRPAPRRSVMAASSARSSSSAVAAAPSPRRAACALSLSTPVGSPRGVAHDFPPSTFCTSRVTPAGFSARGVGERHVAVEAVHPHRDDRA